MKLSFRVPDYQLWKSNYNKDQKLLEYLVEKSGTRGYPLWTMPRPETMILELDDKPVGFITAAREPCYKHRELFLCVDKEFQGKGIGDFLFRHIMQVLQNEHLMVDVYDDQIEAKKFFTKRGFVSNYVEHICEIERDIFKEKIFGFLSKVPHLLEIEIISPRDLSAELASKTLKFINNNIECHLLECEAFPYAKVMLEADFIYQISQFDSAHTRIYILEDDKIIGFLEYSEWNSDCYCIERLAVDAAEADRIFFLQLKLLQVFLERLDFWKCERFSIAVQSFDVRTYNFFERLGELGVGVITYTRP
jgi:GNAT superfamily N-acetyltransferase